MHRVLTLLALTALLAGRSGAAGAQSAAAIRHHELPNFDALELPIPAGWQDRYEPPDDGGQPLIQFSDAAATAFSVEVVPEWSDAVAESAPDAETLREAVRLSSERLRGET